MRCPRCDSPVDDAAARCPACRAPLQLGEEPAPSRLDRSLDLDRRKSRTPVPASPPPPAAAGDEADLGDLSFDPPADDGPWIMAAPEPEASVAAVAEAAAAAELDAARDVLESFRAVPEAEPEALLPPPTPAPEVSRLAELAPDPRAFAAIESPEDGDDLDAPDETYDEDDTQDPDDDEVRAAVASEDRVAAYRGRVLSLASIAIASAAAIVAVLSSR